MAWLKLSGAARATGVSVDLLRRAASAKAFPTIRLSPRGNYRVQLADVQAWLARYQVPADAGARVSRTRRTSHPTGAGLAPALVAHLPPNADRRFS